MQFPSAFVRLAAFTLLALLLTATASQAVIMKLTALGDLLETEEFIFVATVDKLDPDRPSATFALDKKLKGEPPFDRLPVNMTGDDEAKKANDTKTILERLDGSRRVVFLVSRRGKKFNAMAFTEGSWFSLLGTLDEDGKTIRWAFLHGEPYLRRTFKGTTAELVKVIEDGLAKKAKPPAPNEKEKPGYGPVAEKAPKKCDEPEDRGQRTEDRSQKTEDRGQRSAGRVSLSSDLCPLTSGPLLAVIPSVFLVGPLALILALFPGVFARMAVGMKRWRAFLVVASINSTLALVYYAVQTWLPNWIPPGRWFSPRMFTGYLLIVTTVGLWWACRRYRRMASDEPAITGTPSKAELYSLAGLTAFAALCTVLTAVFTSWSTTLEIPMREFTFIGFALLVATAYAGYRKLTKAADTPANGTEPAVRLSLSGETVGLGALFLCGLSAVLLLGTRATGPVATGTQTGDAETIVGPRFVSATAFEVPGATQVMSGVTVSGDRLYFGTKLVRATEIGLLFCIDRHTGKVEWKFEADDDLLPVFSTPTVIDGKVYCGEGLHEDKNCRLFCVNAADGKPLWKDPFRTVSHTEGMPAVVGGKVFFPAGDDGVYCADAATGAKLWQFPGGKDKGIHVDAAPAVSGGTVFVGSGLYSYVAVALDANTGNEKWRTDLKLRAFGAPLVRGDMVFYAIGTGNMGADVYHYPEEGEPREQEPAGAVVCLDAATGKQQWRYDLPRSVHTGLAADAFTLYVGSRDGFVYAIDRGSGKLRWKTGIGGAVTSCPAVATAGGYPVAVYAVSREGLTVCLNPQTGGVVWQKQLPGFTWDGRTNDVLCGPVVVTTTTPTGSKRTIYIGGMTVDPENPAKKTAAVFKFEDELGE